MSQSYGSSGTENMKQLVAKHTGDWKYSMELLLLFLIFQTSPSVAKASNMVDLELGPDKTSPIRPRPQQMSLQRTFRVEMNEDDSDRSQNVDQQQSVPLLQHNVHQVQAIVDKEWDPSPPPLPHLECKVNNTSPPPSQQPATSTTEASSNNQTPVTVANTVNVPGLRPSRNSSSGWL